MRTRRMFRYLLTGAVVMLVPLGTAWGHASLVKSSPSDGQILKAPPSMVQATFSEELDKNSVLRIYDSVQKLVAHGGLDPNFGNHRVLKVVPPRLVRGKYVVQWIAISADDGNVRKGSFRFTVL